MQSNSNPNGSGANDPEITLIIHTPKGTKTHPFPKETKVADVIAWVVKECGFAPGDRFELVRTDKPEEVLKPEKTVVSYHLTDGTELTFTMFGSGV